MRRVMAAVAVAVLALTGCSGRHEADIRFRVAAASAPFDAPLGVSVTGVPAGRQITVHAAAVDAAGNRWSSFATYRPDPSGTVDLATAAPLGGYYTGAHDTGLLWSMTSPDSGYFVGPDLVTVQLTATDNGRQVAAASLTRQLGGPGVTQRATSVAHEGFAGVMFSPSDTAARRPAVLAFGGSEGGPTNGVAIARSLAAKGYAALGIAYFDAPGVPDSLTRIPLEYFVTALRWLARQPGVDPTHLNVYGLSRGSEAALLLGVHFPELVHGVIAGAPSSVVNGNYPRSGQPAWTLRKRPFPYAGTFGDPRPAGEPGVIIPVERIHGPVLLVCGEDDTLWPSCPYADAIASRLGDHPHTELREPGAGHLVCDPVPDVPMSTNQKLGGTQQADALGRLDAWPRLLAFLAAQSGS